MELLKEIGAFAGLLAFLGLALLALLSFTQGRDIRRLREWAGSAPERDAGRKEATSAAAAEKAEEMRRLEEAREAERLAAEERQTAEEREERRRRREDGDAVAGIGLGARLGEPRYLAAIFAIVVLLGGGAAYMVLSGGSDEPSGRAAGGGGGGGGAQNGQNTAASSPRPGEVEVTVLNGTATPGLAATYGDEVEQRGFELGAVTNSTTSFSESVVMYEPGNAPEARLVARTLEISAVEPMTSDIAAVSAGAPVSVVVGEDNASSAN